MAVGPRDTGDIRRAPGCLALLWALVVASACLGQGAVDLEIEKIELHARPSRPDPARGTSPVVMTYQEGWPSAPHEVDVIVKTFGSGTTTAVLEVIPVVGLLGLDQNGTIVRLIGGSLTTLPSSYRIEQPVTYAVGVGDRPQTFTFGAVPVEKIVEDLAGRNVWPRRLIFRVGLLPVPGEPTIANNVDQLELTIEPADS